MDDEKEIIYFALINQIEHYKEVLEDTSNPLKGGERELAEYIFMRTLEIEERFAQEIYQESDQPIKRPSWR